LYLSVCLSIFIFHLPSTNSTKTALATPIHSPFLYLLFKMPLRTFDKSLHHSPPTHKKQYETT
jgi:hypothetical protein